MAQDWLYIVHSVTGDAGWIPDNPGVLAHHQGRGWVQTTPPVEVEEVGPPVPALEEPEINGPQPARLKRDDDDEAEASATPAMDDDEMKE